MNRFILLTGGGSAGHVTPNLALIPRLLAAGCRVEYVGSAGGLERRLVAAAGVRFHVVAAGKLRRYFAWRNVGDAFRVAWGFAQSLALVFKLRPDVLFSKGGYVAVPVVWAAWVARVPVVIHESDLTPGLANRLSMPCARRVCYSFPETARLLPADKRARTGVPVREELLQGDAKRGRKLLGFGADKPILLVVGGSLGAKALNDITRGSLQTLLKHFYIAHICGAGNKLGGAVAGYRQFEYVDAQLKDLLAAATMVVSRAGATMLFELLALRKLHLLVPLGAGASRGDQLANAASFEKRGVSMVLQEADLNEKNLLQALGRLYTRRKEYLSRMRQVDAGDGLRRVLRVIEEVLV